jgi:hypothetical protein
MKKYYSTILLIVLALRIVAQENLSNNKEYFDFLYRYNSASNVFSEDDPKSIGNNVSWQMMQLNKLYEVTKDKAYLVQILHLSSNAINIRYDVQNNVGHFTPYPPKWTLMDQTVNQSSPEQTYFNTLLLIPMAQLVYQIRYNPSLYFTPLPMNNPTNSIKYVYDNLQVLIDKYPNIHSIQTYGDYADWLGARVEETMSYLDSNYWNNTVGHHKFQFAFNENETTFIIT